MSKSDYYNRSADRVGNIYFIGDDARVKIGFARDLSARLSAIKTSASHPVRVFYTFTAKAECEPLIPNQMRYQAALHSDASKGVVSLRIFGLKTQAPFSTGWNTNGTFGVAWQSSEQNYHGNYHGAHLAACRRLALPAPRRR